MAHGIYLFNRLYDSYCSKRKACLTKTMTFRSISLTHVIVTIRKFLIYGLFHIIALWNGLWKWQGFIDKSTGLKNAVLVLFSYIPWCMVSINILRVGNSWEKTLKLAFYQVNKLCSAFSWSCFSSAWPKRGHQLNNFFMSHWLPEKWKEKILVKIRILVWKHLVK